MEVRPPLTADQQRPPRRPEPAIPGTAGAIRQQLNTCIAIADENAGRIEDFQTLMAPAGDLPE